MFKSEKSYGKKEKEEGNGVQDCREQVKILRHGMRVGLTEKMRNEPFDGEKHSGQRKQAIQKLTF